MRRTSSRSLRRRTSFRTWASTSPTVPVSARSTEGNCGCGNEGRRTLGERIVELLPRLRRFARTLTGTAHDADDLVQIAIERALSRSDQLRPDSPLSSWLFGIVRNAWIDEVRARGRRNRVFAPEELGESVADPTGHQHAEVISVQGALARLSEEQREVVGLVLVEGLSYTSRPSCCRTQGAQKPTALDFRQGPR